MRTIEIVVYELKDGERDRKGGLLPFLSNSLLYTLWLEGISCHYRSNHYKYNDDKYNEVFSLNSIRLFHNQIVNGKLGFWELE